MSDVFFETERLILQTLDENSYVNIAKMYMDIENNGLATGLFDSPSDEEIKNKINLCNNSETNFNLAVHKKESNEFIGFIKGFITTDYEGIWINLLMVKPEFHRKGYGKEIINSLIIYFKRKNNVKYAYVSVLKNNYTAKKFWSSQNFVIKETLYKSEFQGVGCPEIVIYIKIF